LQETESPGEFSLWFLTSGAKSESSSGSRSRYNSSANASDETANLQMQRVRISVPRVFYVNCKDPVFQKEIIEALRGKESMKDLPHGRKRLWLVEVSTSERKYMENEAAVAELLNSPLVYQLIKSLFRIVVDHLL